MTRRFGRCRPATRPLRFEALETRWFLSANPAGDFVCWGRSCWGGSSTATPTTCPTACPSTDFLEQGLPGQVSTLAGVNELTGLSHVRAEFGFTGSGQTVAIIDTGIAYDHVALGGGFGAGYRVVGGADFSPERDGNPYDDGPYGAHGTHVAGIIASTALSAQGVAPGVDLVALRVFDDAGRSQFDWVKEALQWVHVHRNDFTYPITTVNLSLGAAWNSSQVPPWASLESELAQLQADGIFIAVAAGNSFSTYQTAGLSYPAASSHVVPVGAVDGDGRLSYFSQREPRMIAAPGRAILSTVPDYLGNHNGLADDFARFSGTSMAAPYVAGASVLLRQAYQFVGAQTVSQQALYDLMVTTADTVYDPVTGQSYHRLNLDRAIDAVMPADDYGSTSIVAAGLGTLSGGRQLSGAIERLADQDWFSFASTASGSVRIVVTATGELLPQWQTAGIAGASVDATGGSLTFSVIAGQSYSFGLASGKGLGHYRLDIQLQAQQAAVSAGTVAQASPAGSTITPPATTTAPPNLVSRSGNTLRVCGSGGDDHFEYRDGPTPQVTINGIVYALDAAVTSVTFDGQGGTDAAVVRFSGGNSSAVLRVGSAELAAAGRQVSLSNVERIRVQAEGRGNRAFLYDSAADDTLVGGLGYAALTGPGFDHRVEGFDAISAFAASGGHDTARLSDSPGNDSLTASPRDVRLSGGGCSVRVQGFETVSALATAGGYDTATLYDSSGDDTLVVSGGVAKLSGPGFANQVEGFEAVHAYAYYGGWDVARLVRSAGSSLTTSARSATLSLGGRFARANYFDAVYAEMPAAEAVAAQYAGPPVGTQTQYASSAQKFFGTLPDTLWWWAMEETPARKQRAAGVAAW